MRRRTILLTALISVVLGISFVSLALPEIHIAIPGLPRLDRAETGPLGLKLGLDLQGGAHLVYQAQTGTTLAVTFPDDVEVDVEAVQESLAGADYQATVSQVGEGPSFEIDGPYLSPDLREAVRLALVNDIGEPTEFVNSDLPPPTSDQMDGVLDIISRRVNLYGTEEPIVQRFGDDRIIVQLPGASGSVVTVQFSDAAAVEKLSSVVDGRGYGAIPRS